MFEKTVIVTGGLTGIGAAVVRLFTDAGANVVVASRKDREQKIYDNITFFETDVRDEEQVQKMIAATLRKFGKIDVVVNSAGINYQNQRDVSAFPTEKYHDIMDTNMTAVFFMTKHVLPHLLTTRGNMITLASQLGLVPSSELPVYSASKAAVVMFTKATALQYASRGVRINCVCPGPTDTYFIPKNFPTQVIPMQRLATPEEVANVVFFLASEKSSFVTGAAYAVDGGHSLVGHGNALAH